MRNYVRLLVKLQVRLLRVFRQPDVVGTALSFTAELFLSMHFSQTSRRGRPSNLYAEVSVLGEATIMDIEISPTPPLIFTGGVKKC